MKRLLPAAALLLLVTACATNRAVAPGVFPGHMPEIQPAERMHAVSEGSLYTEGSAAELIGDFRARHVGDVLIVRITETSLGSATADSKLDKTSNTSLKIPTPLGFGSQLTGAIGRDFDPANAYAANNAQSFDGKGATTRQNTVTAQMAVRVMAIGVGGQMVVAGTKQVAVNRERQNITLAGIVRPEDVAADNSIPSSAIADLNVNYGGTGDVAEMTRQSWFTKLLSKIWPF